MVFKTTYIYTGAELDPLGGFIVIDQIIETFHRKTSSESEETY